MNLVQKTHGSKLRTLNRKFVGPLYLMKFWETAVVQFKCLEDSCQGIPTATSPNFCGCEKGRGVRGKQISILLRSLKNILSTTRTNQKVWLINVAITTSWTPRDYSSRREFYMRKISLQNHSFKPKVFVPRCALPSLIYWYQDNRFGKCSQSQYQRPKICLVYVFNGLSKIPQSPCTLNKSIALSE